MSCRVIRILCGMAFLLVAGGFVRVGTFRAVGWKFDRWLDTVLMQRELDGS